MRFCLLNTFFPPLHFGGDAVFVASLANLLASQGHHVEVVHCADSFQMLRRRVAPSNVPLHPSVVVHTLKSRFDSIAPLAAHCTGRDWFQSEALELILGQGFDVTHWHNASLLGAPAAFRFGTGVRLMTLHEYWLVCAAHSLMRNGTEACTNRTCHSCSISRGRPPQLWRSGGVVGRGLENIDLFLAPSQFVKNKIAEFLPALPIEVLPNFLPDRPTVDAAREDFVLVVARLEYLKGVHTILPMFRDSGRRLKIAGDGDYAGELRKLAAGAPNIEFLGRVPSGELAALYRRARAVVIPSICHETFGLVILEALQQGTPVYASDYGALPGLIAQTRGGRVFHSLDELAKLLDSDLPVEPDLSEFQPRLHLQRYLGLIAALRSDQKSHAHA
jgi:glycosyltransferase involved in cell wall biosynthesis